MEHIDRRCLYVSPAGPRSTQAGHAYRYTLRRQAAAAPNATFALTFLRRSSTSPASSISSSCQPTPNTTTAATAAALLLGALLLGQDHENVAAQDAQVCRFSACRMTGLHLTARAERPMFGRICCVPIYFSFSPLHRSSTGIVNDAMQKLSVDH